METFNVWQINHRSELTSLLRKECLALSQTVCSKSGYGKRGRFSAQVIAIMLTKNAGLTRMTKHLNAASTQMMQVL